MVTCRSEARITTAISVMLLFLPIISIGVSSSLDSLASIFPLTWLPTTQDYSHLVMFQPLLVQARTTSFPCSQKAMGQDSAHLDLGSQNLDSERVVMGNMFRSFKFL